MSKSDVGPLNPGEEVLSRGRGAGGLVFFWIIPNCWSALLMSAMLTIMLFFPAMAMAPRLGLRESDDFLSFLGRALALMAVCIFIIGSLPGTHELWSKTLYITNQRCILTFRRVIASNRSEIYFNDVEHVAIGQSFSQGFLGAGDLTLTRAGTEWKASDLAKVRELYDLIQRQVAQARQGKPAPAMLGANIAHPASPAPCPGTFHVVGVNTETGEDVMLDIDAQSEENAKVKAELKGIVVTYVGQSSSR